MKAILIIIPFVYMVLVIILPIYYFDMPYAASVALLFWLPVLIMLIINWNWISKNNLWKPFWLTNLYLAIVSFYFEFSSLGMDIWDFSLDHHKLLPFPRLFGVAPIEEFEFYLGATPFCLLLYICFFRIIKKEKEYPETYRDVTVFWKIAWLLVGLVFVPILRFIWGLIKDQKVLSWLSVLLTTIIFWVTMAFVEAHSVSAGHWVYNPQRTLHIIQSGFLQGIAIEEFFQYYILGPLFVVFFFHLLELQPFISLRKSRSGIRKPI